MLYYILFFLTQTKNSYVASILAIVAPNSDTIKHKFHTIGHTHVECDSTHAAIEKMAKKSSLPIYHPREWYRCVESSGKHFRVRELTRQMFLILVISLKVIDSLGWNTLLMNIENKQTRF